MVKTDDSNITTIKIKQKTKQRIEKLRVYRRESYDEILQRIIDVLNICRIAPEKARTRLILMERQSRRTASSATLTNQAAIKNLKTK